VNLSVFVLLICSPLLGVLSFTLTYGGLAVAA
jgi:hypothetical protein